MTVAVIMARKSFFPEILKRLTCVCVCVRNESLKSELKSAAVSVLYVLLLVIRTTTVLAGYYDCTLVMATVLPFDNDSEDRYKPEVGVSMRA